jgi:FKBP-type peptidyl-prolyl cis-trans isomerase
MTIKIYSLSPILFLSVFFGSTPKLHAQGQSQATQSQTSSGLVYRIFPGKGGEKPVAGEFVKFNYKYTVGKEDSILQSTFGKMPAYSAVDTGKESEFSYMEIVPKLSSGDSAEILISVDSLKNKNIIGDYNSILTPGGTVTCEFLLLEVLKSDSAVEADYEKEMDVEKTREIKDIEKYMVQRGIRAEKTKGGAYVSVENPGDVTLKADSGTLASIKYKGYTFDGNVFDTNMDSSKGHTEPVEVVMGNRKIIEGWEEVHGVTWL